MNINLEALIREELNKKALDPTVALEPQAVDRVTKSVARAVEKPVEILTENLTNREPWYRSRVIMGLAVALIAKAIEQFSGIAVDASDQALLAQYALEAITWGGSLFALYGRLSAQKAIGR